MMKTSIFCAMLSVGFGLVAGTAKAQDVEALGFGYQGGRFVCESNDGRYRECRINGNGSRQVRMLRQLSRSQCIEGRTWGWNRSGIWVNGGCRAEFELVGRSGYDRDNQDRRDYNRGRDYGRGNQGHGYDYDNRGWGERVVCESHGSRHNRCRIDTRRGVTLVRQLSGTRCREGHNWGVGNNEVWVDHGCRAEFVSNARSNNRWNPGYGYGRDDGRDYRGQGTDYLQCASLDGRQVHCRADILRGAMLIRQFSRNQCVQGRTWGWNRSGVWVSQGCHAEFRVW